MTTVNFKKPKTKDIIFSVPALVIYPIKASHYSKKRLALRLLEKHLQWKETGEPLNCDKPVNG